MDRIAPKNNRENFFIKWQINIGMGKFHHKLREINMRGGVFLNLLYITTLYINYRK